MLTRTPCVPSVMISTMMRTPGRIVCLVLIGLLVVYEVSWSVFGSSASELNNQQTYNKGSGAESESGNGFHRAANIWNSLTHSSQYDDDSSLSAPRFPLEFPKKVWQTSSEAGKIEWAKASQTWQDLVGWDYEFLSDADADKFVDDNYSHMPSIVTFWHSLQSKVIRADMLRYLIMLAQGGVYSDIDTSMLTPPDLWIPSEFDVSTVNAVVGIEYDDTTYPIFVRPISFCQWTLFSKPNHPIFERAISRLISNLEYTARRKAVPINKVELDKKEILAATGPGMITDVIVQVIEDQGFDANWSTFHNIREPRQYGDVLVLPINGFAGNQKHSHSGDPEYGQRLVQHHFARSWYVRPPDPVKPEQQPAANKAPPQHQHQNVKVVPATHGGAATEIDDENAERRRARKIRSSRKGR